MVARPPDEILNLAAEVACLVRDELGPEARVLLHGSWAKGTAAPRSDLDLAISLGRTVDPSRMARIRERLDRLPTLRTIDLLDLDVAGDRMRHAILSEGIEL